MDTSIIFGACVSVCIDSFVTGSPKVPKDGYLMTSGNLSLLKVEVWRSLSLIQRRGGNIICICIVTAMNTFTFFFGKSKILLISSDGPVDAVEETSIICSSEAF